MAPKKCLPCGLLFSGNLTACPKCGATMPSPRRYWPEDFLAAVLKPRGTSAATATQARAKLTEHVNQRD